MSLNRQASFVILKNFAVWDRPLHHVALAKKRRIAYTFPVGLEPIRLERSNLAPGTGETIYDRPPNLRLNGPTVPSSERSMIDSFSERLIDTDYQPFLVSEQDARLPRRGAG
jgi:hypothetical protein